MNSCAFVGYQPMEFFFKNNERHPLCQKIKEALLGQSIALYERGVRRFYVGGELGADMWAGEAILSLKERPEYPGIELVCVLPFAGHNHRWDDESTARFTKLLAACDDKQAISPSASSGAHKKSYYSMIDQSEVIVAVSRNSGSDRSDTAQAVNYAKKRDKEIIFIHPETAEITCSGQK